ncbi:MAG TPA: ATP-binding protein [Candidatus Paceibacterota bacterium]|nr:ATP-binding protein [Candidatus Paceibacterota bacterium]
MKIRLSQKILGLSLFTATIMISAMLVLGFSLTRRSVEQGASRFILDKMSSLIFQVDELLAGYQTQLQIIATDPAIASALAPSTKNSEGEELINKWLSNLLVYSGPWNALLLVGPTGKTLSAASLREGGTSIDITDEEKVIMEASRTSQVAYGDAYVYKGETVMSYVIAIRSFVSGKEHIDGYVIGRIAWRSVEDILSRDNSGVDLFRSDGALIASFGDPHRADAFDKRAISNFVAPETAELITIDGTLHMKTLTREKGVPNYQGNNWVLASVRDATTYIAAAEMSIQQIVIVATVAIFLMALVFVYLISRTVVQPVLRLRAAATEIAQGDFAQQVEVNTKDEIGELAGAFQTMSTKLSSLYGSLEERVREKTSALEKNIDELGRSKKQTELALKAAEDAEEKMREKSKQVEDAFEEVQRFARSADRERLTYSLLISSIGEGVIVIDAERHITVINETAERMLGRTSEEVRGKDMRSHFQLLSNDRNPLGDEFMLPIFAEGKLHAIRFLYLKRMSDGAEMPISGVIAPITDAMSGGIVRGAIFTLRDVTEEKALEEARVGFISTASHQLRTPLTSMRWFTEMLEDGDAGPVNDEQRHFLERIGEGVERMTGLVNMLLQIARVEAGRVAVEPEPVDMKEIAIAVAKTIEVQLAEHRQKITVTAEPDPLPHISLDKDYPWQVIQNLYTNAQRYAFDDTTIEVKMRVQDDQLVFSVQDHGIGIPKSAYSRMYEKFYRAENALTKVPAGTGLGLSLTKSLVEEMGGKLSFESVEGEGTVFTFTIPLSGMKSRKGEVKLLV